MKPLTADLVARVVLQEAEAAGTTPWLVLSMVGHSQAKQARHRAFRRLVRETGCSATQLANIWGCDVRSVTRCLNGDHKPAPTWADSIQPAPGEAPPLPAVLATFAAIDRMRGLA